MYLNEKAEERANTEGDYYEAGWRALQAGRVFRLRHQATLVLDQARKATDYWNRTHDANFRGEKKAEDREYGSAFILQGKGYFLRGQGGMSQHKRYSLNEDFRLAIQCFEKAWKVLWPLCENTFLSLAEASLS